MVLEESAGELEIYLDHLGVGGIIDAESSFTKMVLLVLEVHKVLYC